MEETLDSSSDDDEELAKLKEAIDPSLSIGIKCLYLHLVVMCIYGALLKNTFSPHHDSYQLFCFIVKLLHLYILIYTAKSQY